MLEAYKRAARIYSANRKKHVLNERVTEHWINGSRDFWFAKDVSSCEGIGTEYMRYVYEDMALYRLFDHVAFAEALGVWHENAKPLELPVNIHGVDGKTMYFSINEEEGEFCYELKGGIVKKLEYPLYDQNEATSPDFRYSVYTNEGNIFCRDNGSGKITQLTTGGSDLQPYARRYQMISEKLISKEPRILPLGLKWSPDSKRFLTYRTDTRGISRLHLIQSDPLSKTPAPVEVSYPYSMPADAEILTAHVYLVDVESKHFRPVLLDGQPLTLFSQAMFDAKNDQLKWTGDGKTAYLVRYDRYFKKAQAVLIDMEACTARIAAEQVYETFGFTEYFGFASQEIFNDPGLLYLPESEELIWLLERDECASLFLIDAADGRIKRDLTPGPYTARRMRHYNKNTRTLYFTASGRESGIDPYYQLLYAVNLDSGQLTRISEQTAEHIPRFSPDGGYFIDTYSTVQAVPETFVCRPDGTPITKVAEADVSRLVEKGYIEPEPFRVLARDGVTPIYGIMVKPFGFDPNKKYPVVDYIYGGSQRINTPKAFQFHEVFDMDPMGGLQSLAQLGFIGIIVDGLATPLRTKSIHDMAYGKPEECCGIEDHVCALRQLAEQYSWVDLDRVGIWGSSGGGYATVRAMLQFPDFFKVGVSLCGDHDQAKYHTHWGDRWVGPYSEVAYHNQANRNFARNLEGRLLLIHGDMDDNVHPSATIQLAAALIHEDKDFDMLLYPNGSHFLDQYPYVTRRRWDFFVRHLLREEPPRNFSMEQVANRV
ncbi:DPP IV N-terminal domain-containing protein [Brevibacillus reuszeri]|uniref:S9 family peptidase n=1 Tax=Brevibacillus reuszeri TaxID=54915 RepID=UPI003D25C843